MLKLHGFPLSNYFNMAKIALLEKEADFEVVNTAPSQDDDYLAKSPMGKIPCLETADGFLTETDAIMDYIEETVEGPSFYPEDPFARAKVRELMKELELYVELPGRTCYPAAFFGGEVSDAVKEKAKTDLAKGIGCLKRNGKFSPYVAGDTLTYADFVFMYSVNLASIAAKKVLALDLLGDFPETRELMGTLNQRDSAKQVAADQKS